MFSCLKNMEDLSTDKDRSLSWLTFSALFKITSKSYDRVYFFPKIVSYPTFML